MGGGKWREVSTLFTTAVEHLSIVSPSVFLHQTIHFEAILAGISKIAPLRSSDIKRSKPKQKNINKSWLYLHILQ